MPAILQLKLQLGLIDEDSGDIELQFLFEYLRDTGICPGNAPDDLGLFPGGHSGLQTFKWRKFGVRNVSNFQVEEVWSPECQSRNSQTSSGGVSWTNTGIPEVFQKGLELNIP